MNFVEECNCGNCAKSPCEAIVSCSETIGNNKALENVFRGAFAEFIAKTGCLSHPRAREVVMADVVDEFKRQQSIAIDGMKSKDGCYSQWQERYCSFGDAIDILQNGGKK